MPAARPPRPLLEEDDRTSFDCGRESLNLWFRRHALANHVSGASRVYVLADPQNGKIQGYVTLSASQIARAFLPKPRQRNQPDPLPVTLLGQLAVDKSCQGQGYAALLLQHAFLAALHVSEQVGSIGIVTHPIDDRLRSFYARWGFQDLPHDPKRAMIVRMADLRESLR